MPSHSIPSVTTDAFMLSYEISNRMQKGSLDAREADMSFPAKNSVGLGHRSRIRGRAKRPHPQNYAARVLQQRSRSCSHHGRGRQLFGKAIVCREAQGLRANTLRDDGTARTEGMEKNLHRGRNRQEGASRSQGPCDARFRKSCCVSRGAPSPAPPPASTRWDRLRASAAGSSSRSSPRPPAGTPAPCRPLSLS